MYLGAAELFLRDDIAYAAGACHRAFGHYTPGGIAVRGCPALHVLAVKDHRRVGRRMRPIAGIDHAGLRSGFLSVSERQREQERQ